MSLYGDLKRKTFTEVSSEFNDNLGEKTVCQLKKALYGLKQSP